MMCAEEERDACDRALHLEGVTYDATSNWGIAFVITLSVCTVLYVGGGIGFANKTQGKDLAISSHPHFGHWAQLRGLVTDGAIFAKAKIDERRKASGGALGEALVDEPDSRPEQVAASLRDKQLEDEEEEAEGGEDGLVE